MSSPAAASSPNVSGSSLSQSMINQLKQERTELEQKVERLHDVWNESNKKTAQEIKNKTGKEVYVVSEEFISVNNRIKEIKKLLGVHGYHENELIHLFSNAIRDIRKVIKGKNEDLREIATSLGYINRSMLPRISDDSYRSLLANIKDFQTLVESTAPGGPVPEGILDKALSIYSAVELPPNASPSEGSYATNPEFFLRFMRTLYALNDVGFYHGKPDLKDLKQGLLSDEEYQKLGKDITEFLTILKRQGNIPPEEFVRAQVLSDEIQSIIKPGPGVKISEASESQIKEIVTGLRQTVEDLTTFGYTYDQDNYGIISTTKEIQRESFPKLTDYAFQELADNTKEFISVLPPFKSDEQLARAIDLRDEINSFIKKNRE